MADFIKTRLFWVTFIVVAMVVFAVGSSADKTYVAETDLLLLPKNEATSRNIKQIISNAKLIPESLSFYNKLLQKNSDIEDQALALPDDERKKMWNARLRVEQKKGSGVLAVKVFNQNALQAELVSEKTAKDIAVVMSRYYDIKTELDIRLIDGPIVAPVKNIFNLWLALISIGIGLLAGIGAVLAFGGGREPRIALPKPNWSFPSFSATKPLPKKEITKETFAESLVKKEMASSGARKAAAPENLPVGSEFVLNAVRRAEKEARKAEEIAAEPKTHEATEEEIKNRLNKLLGGKM
ncbi:MAG: hypothetical protein WC238_02560 [Parcubacteria group bacterium]|jgi:hypothetical protein